MNKVVVLLFACCWIGVSYAQEHSSNNLPEFSISPNHLETHLRFLASDELQGRYTGSLGNQIAARYIAEQFRSAGVQIIPGQTTYFQAVPFAKYDIVKEATIQLPDHTFSQGDNLVLLSGGKDTLTAPAILVGNGWIDEEKGINDYEGKEVEGKIAIAISGIPGSKDPMQIFSAISQKRIWAQERGAVGLIEIYQFPIPWNFISSRFTEKRLELIENDTLVDPSNTLHAWVNDPDSTILNAISANPEEDLIISTTGRDIQQLVSNNVVGLIPGSDSLLANEYILLSAHYDHVGVGSQGGNYTKEDSIFNGARDNGLGTIALLAAAEALAKAPPKRSVILLACTAEEVGLLGSKYYAEHPLIPLKQTIFNLNTDGAGYADTTAISIFGFYRVGAEAELQQASETFGLTVIPDPAPNQNLFDRSDNVSFAKKGIPAPTLSPGFSNFDMRILQYYHRPQDEVESIDFTYVTKYVKTFVHASRLVANKAERPAWKKGDKYEMAGKKLYGEGE